MRVGDLVRDNQSNELVVIVRINPNGDCACLYPLGLVFLTSPRWLEVI
jgi:hypothetical protein